MRAIGLVAMVILVGGRVEAAPDERAQGWPGMTSGRLGLVPGFRVRNGDWFVVDALGIALLGPPARTRAVAVVARGEAGIGGAGMGVGVATNALPGPYPAPGGVQMSDFVGSGIGILEARAEWTYGLTSWRRTTYVGGQLSLAAVVFKPSVGVMVDAHDRRDRRVQVAFLGAGW